jgi:hypothetical protein
MNPAKEEKRNAHKNNLKGKKKKNDKEMTTYIIGFIDQAKLHTTIASSADIWMILKQNRKE